MNPGDIARLSNALTKPDNNVVASRFAAAIYDMANEWRRWGAPVDAHRETDQCVHVIVDGVNLDVRVSVRKEKSHGR